MAIEVPNALEAQGSFDGNDPPSNPDPIFTSDGVLPFDPATTPGAPVGGFTRVGLSNYLLQLVRPINFREGVVQVTCMQGKPDAGCLCAIIVPAPVVGAVSVMGDGANDYLFQASIFRHKSGTVGTSQP